MNEKSAVVCSAAVGASGVSEEMKCSASILYLRASAQYRQTRTLVRAELQTVVPTTCEEAGIQTPLFQKSPLIVLCAAVGLISMLFNFHLS